VMLSVFQRAGLRVDSLARASAALMSAQIINGVLGLLFWMVVSRDYPVAQVGEATTVIALVTSVTLVTTAGFTPMLLLAIPRSRDRETAAAISWTAYGVAGGFGAATAALAGVVLPYFSPNLAFLSSGLLLWVVVAAAALTAASAVVDPSATGAKRTWLAAVRAVAFSAGKLGLLVVLLAAEWEPVYAVAVAWGVTAGVTSVVVLAWAHRWVVPRYWRTAVATMKSGLSHHYVSAISAQLPPLLVAVMVTGVLGTAQSARYSITWALASVFFMVSPSIASASLAHAAADSSGLRQRITHAARLTAAALVIPVGASLLFASSLVSLFGDDYRGAAPLLMLFALSAVPDAVINLAVAAARVRGDLRHASVINVTRGGATLLAVALLLPTIGLPAAALGWLVGQLAGVVLVAEYARRSRIRWQR